MIQFLLLQRITNLLFFLIQSQECSDPDGLQGTGKGGSEGCPLSGKGNTDHFPSSTTDSRSSATVEALETNPCGSAVGPQHICSDAPHVLSGKPQQPEPNTDPEFIKENGATCSSTKEQETIKETVVTQEKELDGDHLSSVLNKTVAQNIPDLDSIKETNTKEGSVQIIKETNTEDGSVQIIKDHTTHCAFSFQNALLYDLD